MNNNKFKSVFALAIFTYASLFNNAVANEFILDDAERFASLLSRNFSPNEKQIKIKYLDLGTKGIDIFTPNRIEDEKNLALAISENPKAYEKGINICLPAARNSINDAEAILKKIQNLLGQKKSAPTFILFGANNSGGTANSEGLSLGLEVICRPVDTKKEAKEEILGFVAHEIVHVYQSRNANKKTENFTLLRQALVEGFADFVANVALGKITKSESERHNYGLKNEALIWSEFKVVMLGKDLKPWMYGAGKDDRPNDLGYWLGKRIAKAYYENADDKKQALNKLLYLDDPESILLASAYDPK